MEHIMKNTVKILQWPRFDSWHRQEILLRATFIIIIIIITLCGFCFLAIKLSNNNSPTQSYFTRSLLQVMEEDIDIVRNMSTWNESPFPKDLFTMEELKKGAVILYIIGIIYMVMALIIVSYKFFVPSVLVIREKLQISENVAGATFSAFGLAAPSLFTSIIGAFVSLPEIRSGQVVGSAVFIISFVIAMSTFFARSALKLTKWPLLRDFMFYAFSFTLFAIFISDQLIHWYEALTLIFVYILYCILLKFNENIEDFLKRRIMNKNTVTIVQSTDQNSSAVADVTNLKEDNTGEEVERGTSVQCNPFVTDVFEKDEPRTVSPSSAPSSPGTELMHVDSSSTDCFEEESRASTDKEWLPREEISARNIRSAAQENGSFSDEPIDLSWPRTPFQRFKYIILAPIMFLLWLTLPQTGTPNGKRFFVVTYLGSIIWTMIFLYFMVWWATIAGYTFNIPTGVMGLTLMAAGGSIPEIVASVIMAKKGLGDMIFSTSNGRNIFGICVGLPLPWLLFFLAELIRSSDENSIIAYTEGMACSISLLFLVVILVGSFVLCSRWQLNKCLGSSLFFVYFIFIIISLAYDYRYIVCPL